MIKLGAAVLVASFVTGLVVTAPGVTPQVEAHTYAVNVDRLEAPRIYGAACSERGWPYFETNCLRDTNTPTREARNTPTREARAVRMVGTDRVPARR
jgi:hypothetical protein